MEPIGEAERIVGARAVVLEAFSIAMLAEAATEREAMETIVREHVQYGRCRFCDPLFFFHLND